MAKACAVSSVAAAAGATVESDASGNIVRSIRSVVTRLTIAGERHLSALSRGIVHPTLSRLPGARLHCFALERAVATESAAANELVAAEADLSLAESTLTRYQTLYDKEIISRQQFDEIKARQQSALAHRDLARAAQQQAKAAVAEARAALDFTRVLAPFDGIVAERKLDPGALASPGVPILTIEDVTHYRLEANVNENDLRYVRLGQQVPVSVDVLGYAMLTGRVTQIVPAADAASRTFIVKVELPVNKELRSGLFGHAQFSRGQKSALLVPQTAVIERGQLHAVYVLDPSGIPNLRYVTLGRPTGAQVEVLAGVQDGERVVAQPGGLDLSGTRVEAQP